MRLRRAFLAAVIGGAWAAVAVGQEKATKRPKPQPVPIDESWRGTVADAALRQPEPPGDAPSAQPGQAPGAAVASPPAAAVPPITELQNVVPKPTAFGNVRKPHVLRSEKEAAEHFDEGELAKLKQQVDFSKQFVLLFAWQGSGQDRLEHAVAESYPEQVFFTYKPGRTRDLREHVRLYALRSNVTWSVK
ncbi:MAG: hypothetical protein FJ290_32420 [Planctomycetes bacterium]|nr:hypothetical protein [Planctomycetota bacterium]